MKREAWRLNVRERIWKSQINMKTFKMATETNRKKGRGRDEGEEFFLGWEKSIKRLTNKENESRFFYLFLTYNLQNDVILEAVCVHQCKPKKIGRLFYFLLYKMQKKKFSFFFKTLWLSNVLFAIIYSLQLSIKLLYQTIIFRIK